MAKQFLSELKIGEHVETFAALRKMELREYNGSHFLLAELGDRSGRIKATLWNNAKEAARSLQVGDVVKVIGTIVTYKDTPQIKIEGIRSAQQAEYDVNEVFHGPHADPAKLEQELDSLIALVQTPFLQNLLERIFSKQGRQRLAFANAPGGKLWHHNYKGGLLEHTVSVAKICRLLGGQYSFVDADLLLTAALLHDIGKTAEYNYETPVIDFSDQGRLKGHLVIGYEMVNAAIKEIPSFPEEFATCLGHMVLSHQGQRGFGSPVVPQTLEALLLYYADEMDSKTNAFHRILTETRRTGKTWSAYVPLMDRYLYAGCQNMMGEKSGGG